MKREARPRSICKFENKMEAYRYGQGRRKGQRNYNVERQMDHNWRTGPRSASPSSSLVNGSPHPSYKREPTTSPADYEHKKNVEFLKREWKKFETEYKRDAVTPCVLRDNITEEFPAFDLDAFLEVLHQRQQQQPQQ